MPCELDRYTLVGEPVLELPHLDVEDLTDVVLGQRIKHDDLIDSVQELRSYRGLEHVMTLFLHSSRSSRLVAIALISSAGSAPGRPTEGSLSM